MKRTLVFLMAIVPTACLAAQTSKASDASAGTALGMGFLFLSMLSIAGLAFYFIPSIIAATRKHRNKIPIVLVNLFFGWTFIGWVVALVWSFTADVEGPTPSQPVQPG